MKDSLQINMKMPTIVAIFIFISREKFMLSWAEYEIFFYNHGTRMSFLIPLWYLIFFFKLISSHLLEAPHSTTFLRQVLPFTAMFHITTSCFLLHFLFSSHPRLTAPTGWTNFKLLRLSGKHICTKTLNSHFYLHFLYKHLGKKILILLFNSIK